MRRVQVSRPNGPLEIVEYVTPDPGSGSVRIKVQACGICHSDTLTKKESCRACSTPERRAMRWLGSSTRSGPAFKDGRTGAACRNRLAWWTVRILRCLPPWGLFRLSDGDSITGVTYDGGYADYMIARAEALARVPETLSPEEAAPLMCAGVTTFNCLRHSDARAGDVVAIHGLGGLGHLGVQFAAKMDFRRRLRSRAAETRLAGNGDGRVRIH